MRSHAPRRSRRAAPRRLFEREEPHRLRSRAHGHERLRLAFPLRRHLGRRAVRGSVLLHEHPRDRIARRRLRPPPRIAVPTCCRASAPAPPTTTRWWPDPFRFLASAQKGVLNEPQHPQRLHQANAPKRNVHRALARIQLQRPHQKPAGLRRHVQPLHRRS